MGSGLHSSHASQNGDAGGESPPLEEIRVVRQNSGTPRRRRKSSEDSRGSTPGKRSYPKGRGKGEDERESISLLPQQPEQPAAPEEPRPRLEHARSEPSSRLQFFALNHRLFQPHGREDDATGSERRGGPASGGRGRDDAGEWLPASGGQEGLPWMQERRPGLPALNTRPADGSRPPTPGGPESESRLTPGSDRYSVSDLPEPEAAPPPPARSLRRSVTSSEAAGTASTGLTAAQTLAQQEQLRTLVRGESLTSGRGSSLRSILKSKAGGGGAGGEGMLRMPTMVDLAVASSCEQRGPPQPPPAVLRGFAVKDDALPLPRALPAAAGEGAGGLQSLGSLGRRVTWREAEAVAGATPVVDHGVAGDLHLGGPTAKPCKGPAPTATPPGSGPPDRHGKEQRARGNMTPASSDMQFDEEVKDEKQLAEEDQHRLHWYDFWKHHRFWAQWAPAIWVATLFTVGIAVYIWERPVTLAYFNLWSWCFFLGSLPALYWASRLFVHCLVLAVESTLFTTKQVLYYTYGVRKPLARLLRVCLVLPIFVACFSGRANDSAAIQRVYMVVVRVLGCAILFFFANVAKAFLGRMISSYFHKEAHFVKLQQALQKEYYIMALSQPRTEVSAPAASAAAARPSLGGASVAGEGQSEVAPGGPGTRRSSAVYDRLVRGLPRMKKGGSLPDLVQAEQRTAQGREAAAAAAVAANPQAASGEGVAVLRRPSMQQPMRPFLGRVSPSGASMLSRSHSTVSRRGREAFPAAAAAHAGHHGQEAPSQAGSHPSQRSQHTVRDSHRPDSHATHTPHRAGKFLLRTAAFKKDVPQAESVTELTTALEGVRDVKNPKAFNGDLIRKLNNAEKHIRKNKLKVSFADQLGSAAHTSASEREVASKQEAKRLAFWLFWNVKPYFDRNHILPEDLAHFLPPNKAAKAFELLDVDGDGKVSLHDIRDAVLQIYKERKDLALTLKDTRTITGKLEMVIGVCLHIFFILLYLFIFQVDVNRVWLTFSSMVVAFSFIFATAISNLFQSVLFLFVSHPFDVGDGILIGQDMHYVEEISLQNCVFKRWDGARVWYPNTVMLAAPIINVSRSGSKWESFTLYIDIGTPSEFFVTLNKRIEEHMEANSNELSGEFACCNFGCGDPMKIKLGVYFEFTHSGTDLGRLNVARHGLATCICDCLVQHGVRYSMPAFPGGRAAGEAAGAEMGRPLAPAQAPPASVMHAASSHMTARQAHAQAVAAQYAVSQPQPAPDGTHPAFMQRFS